MAIAVFYAVGTGVGGLVAPALFGALIETKSRSAVFGGYAFGALLMLGGAAVALVPRRQRRAALARGARARDLRRVTASAASQASHAASETSAPARRPGVR